MSESFIPLSEYGHAMQAGTTAGAAVASGSYIQVGVFANEQNRRTHLLLQRSPVSSRVLHSGALLPSGYKSWDIVWNS